MTRTLHGEHYYVKGFVFGGHLENVEAMDCQSEMQITDLKLMTYRGFVAKQAGNLLSLFSLIPYLYLQNNATESS